MISVVVYTRNDKKTVESCLQSLTTQRTNTAFDVFVIDDCSSDSTPQIVSQRFPQFRLIRNDRTLGWVVSLKKHLPSYQGDIIALLGAHCRAREGWVAAIEKEVANGHQVITGMGYYGDQRLLERFEAVTINPDFVAEKERKVDSLWDDNFVIFSKLLKVSLPNTNALLSDGAGAALLSRRLKEMGIKIFYAPSIKIDHITHSLFEIFRIWYAEIAKNAIATRMVDHSLPGARFLGLGPLLAAMITAGRFVQVGTTMIRKRCSWSMSPTELGFHMALFACLMPVYFLGMCRHLLIGRDRSCCRFLSSQY
jgi:glycosyltransferase involved in cell wall biosynthesis